MSSIPGQGPIITHTTECGLKSKAKNNHGSFPGGPVVKNSPANAGNMVQSLLWEDTTCPGTTKPMYHDY